MELVSRGKWSVTIGSSKVEAEEERAMMAVERWREAPNFDYAVSRILFGDDNNIFDDKDYGVMKELELTTPVLI
ncbi:hypothetical protein CFP56_008927 [Quercus suber]|uniref:Uncharacterized protein n=1 Tax=Quercus suber TaxID=58331 RepID=A0AAW0L2C3_QUESU